MSLNVLAFSPIASSYVPKAAAAITGFNDNQDPTTIELDKLVNLKIKIPLVDKYDTDLRSHKPHGSVSNYKIEISLLDTDPINTIEGYKKAAELSVKNAKKLAVVEKYTATTDNEGIAAFPGLKPGAYLVVAQPPTDSSFYYPKPQEMVVVVPTSGQNDKWNYDVLLIAKFEPHILPSVPNIPTNTPPSPPASTFSPSSPSPAPEKPAAPLAMTGAAVLGLVMAASVLILGGFTLLILARRKKTEGK